MVGFRFDCFALLFDWSCFSSIESNHSHALNRCGPCKFIHPIYERMAEENPDVVFTEVDVDEADDVAAHVGIKAMPTFHFYKGGEKVEEMMGADTNKLTALVAKLK
jgi:thioredoxin 1